MSSPAAPEGRAADAARQTVLIVEDAPANVKVLYEALKGEYRVRFAISAEDALAMARSDPPDLILLDVMLPGMDGYELCRVLKAEPATSPIPVVFITARAQEEDETRGLELGAVDYIAKPFSLPIVRARVRTHLALRRQHEMEARQRELESRNEALARLDRLKDEFLANTSHELRTPLSGIIGLAESSLHGRGEPMSEDLRHNLALIVASGRRLANLVDDILDYSQLKTRSLFLARHAVDLHALTDVVLRLHAPLVADRPLRLANEVPPELAAVDADENRLTQVLFNLVGNAVKFTREGTVTISAAPRGTTGDEVEVSVVDTGIGIPEDRLEAIFESFEQADPSITREHGGTGLGLSITRKLVELHGGRIHAVSRVGAGARFTFTLPTAQGKGEVRTPSMAVGRVAGPERFVAPQAMAGSSSRILVVDDEAVNQQVLANYLTGEGYHVGLAWDGDQALKMLDASRGAERYDMVLLDIMMPRVSGFQVCRRIRDRWQPNELPVLMLSAKNQVSDLTEGLAAGANDYLTKPFSRDELLARVRTHLNLLKINTAYGRFVPHEFLRTLGRRSIIDVCLGDHIQREMSVFFLDIRNFTTLSEAMTPQESFDFINGYLHHVIPSIRRHGGFVDKYVGDAIMAIFPHEPVAALEAAIETVRRAEELGDRQGAPLRVGLGLHTGNLMLGTIGDEERMDVTVISDAVNLASRLEKLSKVLGASILVSENVRSAVPAVDRFPMRFLGKIRVRGRKEPVGIYEVHAADPAPLLERKDVTLLRFEEAIAAYYGGAFTDAARLLDEVVAQCPDDRPAHVYLDRARRHAASPPRDGWDGLENA